MTILVYGPTVDPPPPPSPRGIFQTRIVFLFGISYNHSWVFTFFSNSWMNLSEHLKPTYRELHLITAKGPTI